MTPPTHTLDSVVVGDTWPGVKLALKTGEIPTPINLTGASCRVMWSPAKNATLIAATVSISDAVNGEITIAPQKFATASTHLGFVEVTSAAGVVLTYVRLKLPVIAKVIHE